MWWGDNLPLFWLLRLEGSEWCHVMPLNWDWEATLQVGTRALNRRHCTWVPSDGIYIYRFHAQQGSKSYGTEPQFWLSIYDQLFSSLFFLKFFFRLFLFHFSYFSPPHKVLLFHEPKDKKHFWSYHFILWPQKGFRQVQMSRTRVGAQLYLFAMLLKRSVHVFTHAGCRESVLLDPPNHN